MSGNENKLIIMQQLYIVEIIKYKGNAQMDSRCGNINVFARILSHSKCTNEVLACPANTKNTCYH